MAKKQKTYAEEAKTIMNKYKLRLGDKFDKRDSLSLEAMNQELTALRERQEVTRAAEMDVSGFARATGEEELQEFHTGGPLGHTHPGEAPMSQVSTVGVTPQISFGDRSTFAEPTGIMGDLIASKAPDSTQLVGGFDESKVGGQRALGNQGGGAFKSRVPWMGAASSIAGALIGGKKVDLPEYEFERFKAERVAPQRVSYARGREQIQRERDIATARTGKAARGFGSQSALMEATLAGTTQAQTVAGQQFEQSLEQEANINAQMRERASQFNVAQQAQAAQLNIGQQMYAHDVERGNVMEDVRRRDVRGKELVGAATGYTKDIIAAGQYDQMLQMMAPDEYELVSGEDKWWKKALQISPEMEMKFRGSQTTLPERE